MSVTRRHQPLLRNWRFVDSFRMTVTGKVQKFRMRELAIAELQLENAAAVTTM